MKAIVPTWLAAATFANAVTTVCGKGFCPVMVMVMHAGSGTPIKGAIVRLEDAGHYRELEIDPERRTKILPDSLGKAITTNTEGVAVVFSYGGWAETITEGGPPTYSRPLIGTVVVEYEGKEIYRSTLKAWAEKNKYKADTASVPLVIVSPEEAKSQ